MANGIKERHNNQPKTGRRGGGEDGEEEQMWGSGSRGMPMHHVCALRETEEDELIIDDCLIFLAMAHIALAEIPRRRPQK